MADAESLAAAFLLKEDNNTMQLWAKSLHAQVTLADHAADCASAALSLFSPEHNHGRSWSSFFLMTDDDLAQYQKLLTIACWLHDIGKANAHFQEAVSGKRTLQSVRHEHLSAQILLLPEIRNWLANTIGEVQFGMVLAAVLSHHLKASRGEPYKWCQPRQETTVPLFLNHDDITLIFNNVAHRIGTDPQSFSFPSHWIADTAPWDEAYAHGLKRIHRMLRNLEKESPHEAMMLAAIKAGLIVADAFSSAKERETEIAAKWLQDIINNNGIQYHEIADAILKPRMAATGKKLGKKFEWRGFQQKIGTLGQRVLLTAACGTGKTLAAWNWAAEQLKTNSKSHVLFLYPTRGTATEGFRDYVSWAPEDEGMLLHASSAYELREFALNPPDEERGMKEYGYDEGLDRLYALAAWTRRYFSATVDQFLSFMANRYSGICMLPIVADGVVIFDEVHSYDQSMFDALIAFLNRFNGPALCMTATLTTDRKRRLVEEAGLDPYPDVADRAELADLVRLEQHPRYAFEYNGATDPARFFPEIHDMASKGNKILWVVNTVARCQELAKRITQLSAGRYRTICYHSRFRLMDRQQRHRETIDLFSGAPEAGLIAITTQVCEMSLDIDADMLLTELAPAPALVQRFGRANRHLAKGDDYLAKILVYDPDNGLPYDAETLQQARDFISALGPAPLSQHQLAEALERITETTREFIEEQNFLAGGLFGIQSGFRDDGAPSREAVLDTDLDVIASAVGPIDGFLLPLPFKESLQDGKSIKKIPKHVVIADGRNYEPAYGYIPQGGA